MNFLEWVKMLFQTSVEHKNSKLDRIIRQESESVLNLQITNYETTFRAPALTEVTVNSLVVFRLDKVILS